MEQRYDYDLPALTAAIREELAAGVRPATILNLYTQISPTEWGAGTGVDTRRQILNVLATDAGWSPAQEGSPLGAADWGVSS